jgi:hypothetical protein
MKFVSVAEVKNRLTVYLAQARKKRNPLSSLITASHMPSSNQSLSKTWKGWDGISLLTIVSKRHGKVRTMPSTTTYKRGQVIVVNVPFSNHTGIKPRPSSGLFGAGLAGLVQAEPGCALGRGIGLSIYFHPRTPKGRFMSRPAR